MIELGYNLCSEEHGPTDLVRYARQAEEAGFGFAMISDHYHPWTDRQGQRPFVWSVLGAVAHATRRLHVGTAATCPTIRIHPAILAQAAATPAAMMPGRFLFGLGGGENLNEHVPGRYAEAGYDHVWVHQVGADQDGFFRFYESEIIPKLAAGGARAA